MKKIITNSCIGVFCIVIMMSCGKDVKSPSDTTAAKAARNSAPAAQTTTQGQSNHSCGDHSSEGSSGSNSSNSAGQ